MRPGSFWDLLPACCLKHPSLNAAMNSSIELISDQSTLVLFHMFFFNSFIHLIYHLCLHECPAFPGSIQSC